MSTAQEYLDLVTTEHKLRPKFNAILGMLVQPLSDNINLMLSYPRKFDLNLAVGDQLDKTGLWIGRTRYILTPLPSVYFSFDTLGLGFDEGTWKGPFDPVSGLSVLPDDAYRTLLQAKVLSNSWDGSIEAAYAISDAIFTAKGLTLIIVDHGNLTMELGLVGGVPDAVTLALLTNRYLDLKPSGVRILGYFTSSSEEKTFALDQQNEFFDGLDLSDWANIY